MDIVFERLPVPIALIAYVLAFAGCELVVGIGDPPTHSGDGGVEHLADALPLPTTGNACRADVECGGGSVCSSSFENGSLSPVATCARLDCRVSPSGAVASCDEGRGLCLPTGTRSVCIAACTIDPIAGVAADGCSGKDVCNFVDLADQPDGTELGRGYCARGCVSDDDCSVPGERCQIETGECVRRPIAFSGKLGDPCRQSERTCNCLASVRVGYCTRFCAPELGAACPAGWVCDTLLPSVDASGASVFSELRTGVARHCLKVCDSDADCTLVNGVCTVSGGMQTASCKPRG
jgi:hypothetical protein